MPLSRLFAIPLFAVSLAMPVVAPAQSKAGDDPLKSVLTESKDKGRGVKIYTGGNTIEVLVVSVDDKYVTAKSQQSSKIVIRLDRIDAVVANF